MSEEKVPRVGAAVLCQKGKLEILKKGRKDYKYKKGIEEKERGSFTLSEEKVPKVRHSYARKEN